MTMQDSARWIDVPEESQRWHWLEYNVTIKCTCGEDVELYDADLSDDEDRVVCECGREYAVRLVYRGEAPEGLWPRVGHIPPTRTSQSPQFEGTQEVWGGAQAALGEILKETAYEIIPRRPYCDDVPDGLVESDLDFVRNNLDACIAFLEEATGDNDRDMAKTAARGALGEEA